MLGLLLSALVILDDCLENKCDILRIQVILYHEFKLRRLLRILLKYGLHLWQRKDLLHHRVQLLLFLCLGLRLQLMCPPGVSYIRSPITPAALRRCAGGAPFPSNLDGIFFLLMSGFEPCPAWPTRAPLYAESDISDEGRRAANTYIYIYCSTHVS